MTNCKRCGQAVVWPQPYKQGQRPLEADGSKPHDCPAYKKQTQEVAEEEQALQKEAQHFVDEEAKKREGQSKDERIAQAHRENVEQREAYQELYKKDIEAKYMIAAAITNLADAIRSYHTNHDVEDVAD